MAAVDLKDIDPAVVSTMAEGKPKQAPPPPAPKPVIPVRAKIVPPTVDEEQPDAAPTFDTDLAENCLVVSADSKIIAIPRDLAAKVPVVGAILADQAVEDPTPIPIGTSATAAVAIAHWVDHVGTAAAASETKMPGVVLYTDMSSIPLITEWEKDFDARLLTAESDTMLRVVNFAEQNGMIGLVDFCIVALSCAVRGKSNHEMMVALCVDGEEFGAEEIDAGKAAYPWINDIAEPHSE